MATVQDKYRKMVELYNNSWTFRKQLLMMDALLMSGELQTFYFETEHLINMMHEVERKYASNVPFDSKFPNYRTTKPPTTKKKGRRERKMERHRQMMEERKKRKNQPKQSRPPKFFDEKLQDQFDVMWFHRHGTTPSHMKSPRQFSKWRPYHYGWEVNYDWWYYDQWYQSPRKLYPPTTAWNFWNALWNFFG